MQINGIIYNMIHMKGGGELLGAGIFLLCILLYILLIMIVSLIKRKNMGELILTCKIKNKWLIALSIYYLFTSILRFIFVLHWYIRDVRSDEKLDALRKYGYYFEHSVDSYYVKSTILQEMISIVTILIFLLYIFNKIKIYEKGIYGIIHNIYWNKITEYEFTDNHFKFKYKIFMLNFNIKRSIKLKSEEKKYLEDKLESM